MNSPQWSFIPKEEMAAKGYSDFIVGELIWKKATLNRVPFFNDFENFLKLLKD